MQNKEGRDTDTERSDNLADNLIQQAQELIEAAAKQPDPQVKNSYYEAAQTAFKAAEFARHREIDQHRANIGAEVFLLPKDHYRWITALDDRAHKDRQEILYELKNGPTSSLIRAALEVSKTA